MDWQIENKTFQIGSGTHWVCYQNVDRHQCEYFDPFGLIMPYDIKYYLKTSGKKLYIQQMKYKKEIVYYAFIGVYLYLLERQKSRSILNVIHNTKFSFTDQMINHKFLIRYFKNI